jgi:peptidoglycan/LPS O-acetylase OafA/YrhL
MLDDIGAWLMGLGDEHGVDPVVYAVIYVAAAPLFFLSLAWLVRTLRRRGPILLPAASTALFFAAPTLYVFIVGRDLPGWVYALLIGLGVFGAITTVRSIRRRLRSADEAPGPGA